MRNSPSDSELQRLVIDLCRASVMLRIADSRGIFSESRATTDLANCIDNWLNVCEREITPILEAPRRKAPEAGEVAVTPPGSSALVIDLAAARSARADAAGRDGDAERRRPDAAQWAELRRRLGKLSTAMSDR